MMRMLIVGHGRMGNSISELALMRDHKIVATVNTFEDLRNIDLENVDVAIEFSQPDAAYQNIKYLLENDVPVVSGTTGWLDRYEDIKETCLRREGAFFYASNYSIGVNIFFKINKALAALMDRFGEYDVTMREIHHTGKKDAPSGTSISLAEEIIGIVSRKTGWSKGDTDNHEILPITSIREEDVPGTHIVTYKSAVDNIDIKHTAHSRQGFAKGAVMAAEWLKDRKGVFGMDDMLKLDC